MSNSNIAQEVQEVLTNPDEIPFEAIQGEESSPLNQPVIEKDTGGEKSDVTNPNWNVWKPVDSNLSEEKNQEPKDFREATEGAIAHEKAQEPLDAPEQEIGDEIIEDVVISNDKEEAFISMPQATQAADALLGMANNLIEVGGGYFVKINKHEAFFEFDEIIQVIDDQNSSNVERIKLDAEDQALLRPLLAQVLRKKTKKLTPEQQLIGAIVSILMKKAQVIMEIRAENSLLENRILQIVKDERSGEPEKSEVKNDSQDEAEITENQEEKIDANENESVDEV